MFKVNAPMLDFTIHALCFIFRFLFAAAAGTMLSVIAAFGREHDVAGAE